MTKTFFTNENLFKIIGGLLCFIGSYYLKQQNDIIVAMDTRLYKTLGAGSVTAKVTAVATGAITLNIIIN